MRRRYRVVWTDVAEKDLEAIVEYIAEESPQTALKVLRQIKKKADSLKSSPKRGRRVPEFADFRDIAFRELVLPPWRLIYRIVGRSVEVLSFLDSRRDLEELLYARLARVR